MVRILCEAGADLESGGRDGSTPLSVASQNGHVNVVRILIAAGANLDSYSPTALFLASQNGHAQVVRILVEPGANPSIPWRVLDSDGVGLCSKTPLTQAKFMKQLTTQPRTAKRRAYSHTISVLSQARSHSLLVEASDTIPPLSSSMPRLSTDNKLS